MGLRTVKSMLTAGLLGLAGLSAGCGYENRVAAVDGDTAFLTQQLDQGLDVNAESPILRTSLLIYAAAHGHMDTVKMLVDRGADVNAADASGWTPLHAAAYGGHPEVIRFLLEQGALLTPANWYTPTPLGVAEALHHEEAATLLRSLAAGNKERR